MGNNHLQWFDESKRKVLILSFEEEYLKKIAKTLSKIDIEINDAIGFKNDDIIYNKLSLKLWYLTVNNRHLWKHHFIGSQGLILNFSFKEKVKDERIIYEVMNVLNDQNIVGLPVLLVIDINNKDRGVVENLRKEMNNQMSEDKLKMVKFDYVDFDNDINQIKLGFDWLCENMKPLK
jgi:hypothetical protein